MPFVSAAQAGEEKSVGPKDPAGRGAPPPERPELADIFRRFGPAYRRAHHLTPAQRKVMRAVEDCRTAALGGHLERCDHCGLERPAYNSCRNRHCPKCQSLAKAAWLEARRAELLPVGYFHNVFTLPHELNPLLLRNQAVLFDLLFQSAAETLQTFAADPRHGLAGRLGCTALLHTWDQTLKFHAHLHCLIPAGALSFDGRRWRHARANFLFDVTALARMFRGKFLAALQTAFTKQQLRFGGSTAPWQSADGFADLRRRLAQKDWIVYSKSPFGGPEKTLDYLGRYTHRVAISNGRLLKAEDDRVHFHYRDRRDDDKLKTMSLPAGEFIRRFLQHVLPPGFVRIRHFGFLANNRKRCDLARCRELLQAGPPPPKPPRQTILERMLQLTGVDIAVCPRCRVGRMVRGRELSPARLRRAAVPPPAQPRQPADTS